MRKHHLTLLAGLAAGALVAGGVAYSAIPSTVTKQITACYPKTGPDKGKLRVIDAQRGFTCTAAETKVEWSSTGVNWRGNWSVGGVYNTNDAVYYDGTTYRAKSGSTGITPGTNGTKWVYLARAGADGPAGETGADGHIELLGNTTTNVDDPATNVGVSPDVTIGTDGLPIISHHDSDSGTLRVTHCDDLACTVGSTNTVDDPANVVGTYSSITIGVDGLPIIAHRDGTDAALRVTHCDDIECSSATSNTVDDPPAVVGWFSTITIGSDGLPVISHGDADNGALRVTHCDDTPCTSATSTNVDDPSNDVGGMSDITIGADGLPIVSYFDATAFALRVTHCNDVPCTSGTSTTVDDPAGSVGYTSSIAIGIDGLAVIAHQDNTNRTVRVSHCGDLACTITTDTTIDDPTAFVGYGTSLAIGADGYPLIAHLDNGSIVLRITHCSDIACTSASSLSIDPIGDAVGYSPSVAIGVDGNPIIADSNATQGALRVTHCSNRFCIPYHRA